MHLPLLLEVAAHLVVLAGVSLLGDQAAMNLRGGMPLLPRSRFIRREYLVHERAKRTEHRRRQAMDGKFLKRAAIIDTSKERPINTGLGHYPKVDPPNFGISESVSPTPNLEAGGTRGVVRFQRHSSAPNAR